MATILQVLSSSDKVTVQDEVFGNHDDQGKLTKEDQMEIYEKYKCRSKSR